jgi:hypothetical protein
MSEIGLYEDPELYDLLFPAAKEMTSARDEARRKLTLSSEQFYLMKPARPLAVCSNWAAGPAA